MFANLRLKGKLSLGFGLMLFLILGISVVTFVVTGGVANKAIDTKDQSVKLANIANQMKVDVIQVQQWLTDISATRGQDGLDDGFSEAESSRQSFLAGLRQSREIYRRENNSQSLQKLEGIEKAFDAYYETGKTMAQAYIDGGPAEGNKLMARFDDAAEALTNVLTPFIEHRSYALAVQHAL